jgi:hypothetical protein
MKIKISLQVIELEKGNYHLIVTGKFLDGNIGYWALDTGASKTVFDKNLEQYYVLEENSENIQSVGIGEELMLSRYAVMRPFMLGKYKIENLKVALFDLTHINEFYNRTITRISICGLIGSDVLLKYKAVINYKYKTITLTY